MFIPLMRILLKSFIFPPTFVAGRSLVFGTLLSILTDLNNAVV